MRMKKATVYLSLFGKVFLLLSLFLASFGTARANPIYVFRESDGTIRFTNKTPPAGVDAEVFKASHGTVSSYHYYGPRARGLFYTKKLSRRFWDVIERASQKYNLERHLIQAVIHAESYFDPYAVSRKGARGLMQLMPDTARMLGVGNSFEVEDNVLGGTRYLSFLMRKYGDLRLALAAYNAGEGAVSKFNGVPPYRETVDYVDHVLSLKNKYQSLSNG